MSNSIPYDINFNSNSIGNAFTFNSSGSTFNGSISGNTNALLENQDNICTDATSIVYTKNSNNLNTASALSLAEDISTLVCTKSDTGTQSTTQAIMSCDPYSVKLQYMTFNNNTISSSPNIGLSKSGIQICSSLGTTTPPSQIVLSTDGTVLLDTAKTVPTSLADIGTAGEIRFDDTNGILYRCTTTGTTAGSGKWNSYYSTTTAPIVQGSNTLTSVLELKNSDGSKFAFNGTTFTIDGLNSSSVNLSPSALILTSTDLSVTINSTNFNYKNNFCNVIISNGLMMSTQNTNFVCSDGLFSYSTNSSSGQSNSELTFIPTNIFSVKCINGTNSPKFDLVANLSSNTFYVDHYAISNNALNTLPTYYINMQGGTIPLLDMYSTQLSSTNVVQSVKNSDGSYSPYITGLKTDTTTGNLGIYSNSTSPVIVVGTNNSLTVSGAFSCDNGKITGQDIHATSTLTIPSTIYSDLPTSPTEGMMFLVTNGRKPGEATGKGTGCLCVYDGSNWMNVSSGTTVTI